MNEISKPILVVIAGPNGSGKTSLTVDALEHKWLNGCVYINPDNIARDIFGDWNVDANVLEAAKLAVTKREECLINKRSMAFETVFSASDKLDFIIRAKKAGYFIRLFFVGTSNPTINASRVAKRVMEGGHDVPITKIINRYSKSIANCALAIEYVDRAYVYDNSIDGNKPELIFRINNKDQIKIYQNIPSWAEKISQKVAKQLNQDSKQHFIM